LSRGRKKRFIIRFKKKLGVIHIQHSDLKNEFGGLAGSPENFLFDK